MMSDVDRKYIVVRCVGVKDFDHALNVNAETHSAGVHTHQWVEGTGDIFTAVMSRREENKYDDAVAFKKIDITYDEQPVPEGWTMIHHTSKEVVLLKKQTQPKLSLIREYLTQIFQIAEDNDAKDITIMDQIYKLSERALDEIEGTRDEQKPTADTTGNGVEE